MAGSDIQKNQLIGALGIVDDGLLDRIAGVAQVHKTDTFDDPAVFHVETRNNAFS